MVKPAVIAYRKIKSYNAATHILILVCGHMYAAITPRQASEPIQTCLKCSIPARETQTRTLRRDRVPFWLQRERLAQKGI